MPGYKYVEIVLKKTVFPGLGIEHLGHGTHGYGYVAHKFNNEQMMARYGTNNAVVAARQFQDELTRIFGIKNPNFSFSVEKAASGKFQLVHPAEESVREVHMPE